MNHKDEEKCREIYDAEIQPLVAELCKRCEARKISLVISAAFGNSESDFALNFLSTRLSQNWGSPAQMALAAYIISKGDQILQGNTVDISEVIEAFGKPTKLH